MVFKIIHRLQRVLILSKKAVSVFFEYGLRTALKKIKFKMMTARERLIYRQWVLQYDTLSDVDRKKLCAAVPLLALKPTISIIIPVYNVPEIWLRKAIDSICSQIYPHWELCIADDCSTQAHVRAVLEEYSKKDPRIRVVFRTENGHIARATNSALEIATGDFCAFMDNDDVIPEHALFEVASEINRHPEVDLIYTDEDKMDVLDQRYEPYFKPDWSPDLLYGHNYINHLGVYRTSLLRIVGGFRQEVNGSQDYDLLLRFIEKTTSKKIRHIPKVLYHWRAIPGSAAFSDDAKPYAHVAARRAIQDHLDRLGKGGRCVKGMASLHRVIYPVPIPFPKVSIIFPTLESTGLNESVEGVLFETNYSQVDVYVHSKILQTLKKSLREHPRLKSLEVSEDHLKQLLGTSGQVLGVMQAGLVPKDPDWLYEMVGQALRLEIGAVGPMLLHADYSIHQGGLYLRMEGKIAGYSHHAFPPESGGVCGRLFVTQNFSALSDECLFFRRDVLQKVFNQMETLDSENEVFDFCLKLRNLGYRIVWTPFAELKQIGVCEARWKSIKTSDAASLKQDPYYNPNLGLESMNFPLARPPRNLHDH